MKFLLGCLITLACVSSFAGNKDTKENKNARKPNSVVTFPGAKAEALFKVMVASDEGVLDNCTAHTCSVTATCQYDQFGAQKYVCTVMPAEQK